MQNTDMNKDALRGMFTLLTGENPPDHPNENYLKRLMTMLQNSQNPEPLLSSFPQDLAQDIAEDNFEDNDEGDNEDNDESDNEGEHVCDQFSGFPPFYLPSVLHYCLYASMEALQSAQPAFGMHPLSLMCEDTFLLCLYLLLEAHDKNMCDITSERLFRAVIAGVATFFDDVEKDVTTILRLCLPHMIYTYNWLVTQPWCWVFRGELCLRFTPQDRLTALRKMECVWADAIGFVPFTPFCVSPPTTRTTPTTATTRTTRTTYNAIKTQVARPEEPSDTTSWGSLPGTPDEATSANSRSPPARFGSA